MSEVLEVRKLHARIAYWLILDCQHWFKWTSPKPPKKGSEFDCPSCKPLPKVVQP